MTCTLPGEGVGDVDPGAVPSVGDQRRTTPEIAHKTATIARQFASFPRRTVIIVFTDDE